MRKPQQIAVLYLINFDARYSSLFNNFSVFVHLLCSFREEVLNGMVLHAANLSDQTEANMTNRLGSIQQKMIKSHERCKKL